MALQLSHNYEIEALRARLREKLGPEQAKWMFPGVKPGDPITTLPALNATHASGESIEDEIGALTGLGRGASNEWVVAGSRTVDGKADPRQRSAPRARARRSSGISRASSRRKGRSRAPPCPATPGVLLGQNDRIAWGFTTADTDVQDLFVETVDPSDPSKYLTPDGPKPFETREETIRVKDAPDVKLTIRTTRHGPVLSDVSKDLGGLAGPGKAIALAFTGLGDRDTTEEAIMRLNVARNWSEFLDAMRVYQTPTQNIVYADVSGDIGFFSPGLVPLRKSGDGLAPVDGASGAFDWIGVDPVRAAAAAAQPGDRLRLQRQQRQRRGRPSADFRPGLGGDLPRPPHPAVLRHDRQAQPRDFGRHAGRPPVAGRQGIAAVHRNDRAVGRAGAAGSGDARELERGDGQGPPRAADLHRVPRLACTGSCSRRRRG